jgi:ribosomal protein L37AE/L43A
MSRNAGPDVKREAAEEHLCDVCDELAWPSWNGHDGVWECGACGEEIDDDIEEEEPEEDPEEAAQIAFDNYFEAECERMWKGRI